MWTAGSQPFTWVAWVKISVCFTYRIHPFETFEFLCSCIRGRCAVLRRSDIAAAALGRCRWRRCGVRRWRCWRSWRPSTGTWTCTSRTRSWPATGSASWPPRPASASRRHRSPPWSVIRRGDTEGLRGWDIVTRSRPASWRFMTLIVTRAAISSIYQQLSQAAINMLSIRWNSLPLHDIGTR